MNLHRSIHTILLLSSVILAISGCTKKEEDPHKEDKPEFPTDGGGHDLKPIDGVVRFFIRRSDNGPLEGYRANVNGVDYEVKPVGNGYWCTDVDASAFESYSAALYKPDCKQLHGDKPYKAVTIPAGQFPDTKNNLGGIPMFSFYSEQTKDVLNFTPPYAILRLSLSGEGQIASMRISSDKPISGQFDWSSVDQRSVFSSKANFVNMNCTNGGSGKAAGGNFDFVVLPGSHKLKLTIGLMDKRVCIVDLGSVTLNAGETVVKSVNCTPDPSIAFYEGFDNMVWGGDIMGGSQADGWSPLTGVLTEKEAKSPSGTKYPSLTGYEYAMNAAECTTPGSPYFQEYSEANSKKTVNEYHEMSASYCTSRGIGAYKMNRCQEYSGCIALGVYTNRAIFRTPNFSNIKGMKRGTIELDFCFTHNATDNIDFTLYAGGRVTKALLDGTEAPLDDSNWDRMAIGGKFVQKHYGVSVPASATAAKTWHHLVLEVDGIGGQTNLGIMASSSTGSGHGYYLDNICVKTTGDYCAKAEGVTRLLYWNIQNGMWAGLGDNYSSFVEWVKSYQPDICVWCEARSNNAYNGVYGKLDVTDAGKEAWAALAARYGHDYSVPTGAKVLGASDNFPQEVTSIYEITKVRDVKYSSNITVNASTGKNENRTSHGGGLVTLNVSGHKLNIVPLHLIPKTSATDDSMDAYQEVEAKTILEATVLNSSYAAEKDWIWLGDHNSHSPVDKWKLTTGKFRAHTYIRNNTNLKDVIYECYPNLFSPSTGGTNRIDFVYLSPALMDKVVFATTLADSWCRPVLSTVNSSYYDPSDHRPILVDFKF